MSDASADAWTVERVVRWATDDFRGRGIESPRLDAEVLLAHALHTTRIQLIVDAKRPLTPDELAQFRETVKRRRAHEPVAYVLGEREFFGHAFKVDRRALIPRPDTEILVEVALRRTAHIDMACLAADLCTGSGCVAVSVALARPTAFVYATDMSHDAATLALENATRLGAANVAVREGDLFAALAEERGPWRARWDEPLRFDLVTANPPYIPTGDIAGLSRDIRDFEPHLALDGGTDGLAFYERIVTEAPTHLVAGGILAVEVGAGEAPAVAALFERAGFADVAVDRDYARIERVVSGRTKDRY